MSLRKQRLWLVHACMAQDMIGIRILAELLFSLGKNTISHSSVHWDDSLQTTLVAGNNGALSFPS